MSDEARDQFRASVQNAIDELRELVVDADGGGPWWQEAIAAIARDLEAALAEEPEEPA